MAKINVDISQLSNLRADFDSAKAKAANLSPIMEEVAEELRLMVDDAFEEEASPNGKAWKPLSDATLNIRRTRKTGKTTSNKILKDSGTLRRSVVANAGKRSASVGVGGPASKYAHIQQMGNPNNRLNGKRAPIPAREFLPMDKSGNPDFPDGFEDRIVSMIADFIMEDFEK